MIFQLLRTNPSYLTMYVCRVNITLKQKHSNMNKCSECRGKAQLHAPTTFISKHSDHDVCRTYGAGHTSNYAQWNSHLRLFWGSMNLKSKLKKISHGEHSPFRLYRLWITETKCLNGAYIAASDPCLAYPVFN